MIDESIIIYWMHPQPVYSTPLGLPNSLSTAVERCIRAASKSHHDSRNCPTGADGDLMVVLDSNIKVQGTIIIKGCQSSVVFEFWDFEQHSKLFVVYLLVRE